MEFFYKTHYKLSPKNKPPLIVGVYKGLSGERGIRTPGGVTLNSFQDCRIRPLCHSSNNGCKYMFVFLWFKKTL